jgi:hypothetical protein
VASRTGGVTYCLSSPPMVGHGWRRLLGARDDGAWVAGAAEHRDSYLLAR